MKLVADSGPLISLSTTCLLGVLKYVNGVYVTPSVYDEVFSYPVKKKRYMWSALRIGEVDLKVEGLNSRERNLSYELEHLINNLFITHRGPLRIIQFAEVESAVLSLRYDRVLLMDERTLRLVIEDPEMLRKRLSQKIHSWVKINNKALDEIRGYIGDIFVIRSVDLVAYAYEKGYFHLFKDPERAMKGALYALKYAGCAVTEEEIERYAHPKGRKQGSA